MYRKFWFGSLGPGYPKKKEFSVSSQKKALEYFEKFKKGLLEKNGQPKLPIVSLGIGNARYYYAVEGLVRIDQE